MNNKTIITSKNGNKYEIKISGSLLLNIQIYAVKDNTKRKYKNKVILLEEMKKSKEFINDNVFQQYKDFSFITSLIEKNETDFIKIEEDILNLNLTFKFGEIESKIIPIEILNVEYYLIYGPNYERKNKEPFYSSLNNDTFNLNDINRILKNDGGIIDEYEIVCYKYYDESLKGFVKINDNKEYPMPTNNLILEIYFNKYSI